jgi:hypothetical protein
MPLLLLLVAAEDFFRFTLYQGRAGHGAKGGD